MTTQREADLSPELVAIAIEAFNREGGKRAASQFLWTIAEPQMKAALSAARPLIAREVLEDERKKFCLMLDDIADSLAFDAWKLNNSRCAAVIKMVESAQKQFRETATEHNIPLSQEGK